MKYRLTDYSKYLIALAKTIGVVCIISNLYIWAFWFDTSKNTPYPWFITTDYLIPMTLILCMGVMSGGRNTHQ